MPKMRIFQKKGCKIAPALRGSALELQLASGGRRLRPQTFALLLSLTDIDLSKCVSGIKNYFITLKNNTEVTDSKCYCFCFFRAIAPAFHFKL